MAGAAFALGLWMLLQMFGVGAGLAAIDKDDVDNLRGIGIGTSAGSAVALLAAMFVGGLLAGRLANHHDKRVAVVHGALVWALTSLVGLVVISGAVSAVADNWREDTAPAADLATRADLDQALAPINARLREEGKPELATNVVIEAARDAGSVDNYNRDTFVAQLAANSSLTRAETEGVIKQLGDRAPYVVATAHQLGDRRDRAIDAANRAGHALLLSALGLLLGLLAAVGGALLAARNLIHRRGHDVEPHHTTAPYPITGSMPPPMTTAMGETTERNPIPPGRTDYIP